MVKEKLETHVQKLRIGINKGIKQVAKIDTEDNHIYISISFCISKQI